MAQAAWQGQAETESNIVRRLVARPLRLSSVPEATDTATIIALVPATAHEEEDEASPSDLVRLKIEITLMKAVLDAERSENASLRSKIETMAAPGVPVEDVRQMRDRWASLVDQLLRQPR